jgi:hypothetical protein
VEDVDFVKTIEKDSILKIHPIDNVIVLHQSHNSVRENDWYITHMKNKKIFYDKWGIVSSAPPPKPI